MEGRRYSGEPRLTTEIPAQARRRGGPTRRQLLIGGGALLTAVGLGGIGGFEWWRGRHTVDMGSLPEACPQPVRDASRSILDVSFGNPENPFSGVQVQSEMFSNGISVTARPTSYWPESATLVGREKSGTGTVRAASERKTPLDGVIAVGTGGRLGEVSALTVRDKTPGRGDMLFCMDYGATASGNGRYPAADPATGLNLPAIYGGPLLVSRDNEGRGICLTVKNYGEGVPETGPRKGSRGGAVVDKEGKLVGIIVDAIEGNIAQIEKQFGISIKNADRAKDYRLTVFQPVTTNTVMEMEDRFLLHERFKYTPANDCDPEADLTNLEARNAKGEMVPLSENLLDVLEQLADQFSQVKLTCGISGHTYTRSDTGEVSDHSMGKAFDLGFDLSNPAEAKPIVDWLYANRHKLPLAEVLSPWAIDGSDIPFGTNDEHKNHIHIGVQ